MCGRGACGNPVFASCFEDFCDLLEPSARAGGPGNVWTLQSFRVSQSKATPSASLPHLPPVGFVAFLACAVAVNTAVVWGRQPQGRGVMPGGFGCCFLAATEPTWQRCRTGSCPMLCFQPLPSSCRGFGSLTGSPLGLVLDRLLAVLGTVPGAGSPAASCSGSPWHSVFQQQRSPSQRLR